MRKKFLLLLDEINAIFLIFFTQSPTCKHPNTHSINSTPVTAVTAVPPELLHGPIHSPQTSQIQFSPILEEASTSKCVGIIP